MAQIKNLNISYFKSKEGVMIKNTEVILLGAVADYKYIEGKLVRDTKIVEDYVQEP